MISIFVCIIIDYFIQQIKLAQLISEIIICAKFIYSFNFFPYYF